MKKTIRGFTIVELLAVIVIVAILSVIIVTVYNGSQARSRDAKRKVDVANIAKALEFYYDSNGHYPTTTSGGSSLGNTWYTSDTMGWDYFANEIKEHISPLPLDPINTTGSILTTTDVYNYGYRGGSNCGAASGQMFIIVYKLENAPRETFTDGDCATNPIGDSYGSDISYYRVVK